MWPWDAPPAVLPAPVCWVTAHAPRPCLLALFLALTMGAATSFLSRAGLCVFRVLWSWPRARASRALCDPVCRHLWKSVARPAPKHAGVKMNQGEGLWP